MSLFVSTLKQRGYLEGMYFTIGIIGSRKFEDEDYANQGWKLLAPNLTIYGFEADASACQQMNVELEQRNINWIEKHIPLALWNQSGESTLYLTESSLCSSLYPPDQSFIERFVMHSQLIKLKSTEKIKTTTLDEFYKSEAIDGIDFLQVDTQGADLQVLEGAEQTLAKGTLALKVEVEFTPLYQDQPC
jgi:FkbM family methyltransferase